MINLQNFSLPIVYKKTTGYLNFSLVTNLSAKTGVSEIKNNKGQQSEM